MNSQVETAIASEQESSKAAIGFILVIVLLDALSFGLIFPVLPQLVLQFSAGDASYASRAFGLLAASWAAMSFFAAPVLGALSDRFGRRPVILISALGLSIDLVVMALAPTLAWLFVGRILSGATAASFATASAYLADVTPQEQRARRFGLVSGISTVGMILGPAVGGLLGDMSLRAPFWVAAGLTALSWLYGLLVLPESLPKERRAVLPWHAINPIKSFGVIARHAGLASLSAVILLMQLAAQAVNTLFLLYTAHRYAWGPREVGFLLMAFAMGTIVMVAVVSPRLVKIFGERPVVLWGLTFMTLGFFGLAVAPSGLWFCAACALACCGNISTPPMQALLTCKAGPQEQGRLQGALSGLVALAGVIGPISFAQIFAWSVSPGLAPEISGIALLASATLAMVGWILAWKVVRNATSTAG